MSALMRWRGILVVLVSASLVQGEDSAEEKRYARMRNLAESIEVFTDGDGKQLAKLSADPIFVWANPQREAIGGMAFLWTHLGRPHATIGIWTYDDTEATDSYEFQSLAERPFRTNQAIWPTGAPGVEYKPLSSNLKPSVSKGLRLAQMRQLVRKNFTAHLMSNSKRVEKLRFLPTPVYRYTKTPPDVIDGAVFSFAQGTDPEVFVILEVRQTGDSKAWYYAIANQTSESTEVSLGRKIVWTSASSRPTFRMVIRRPS